MSDCPLCDAGIPLSRWHFVSREKEDGTKETVRLTVRVGSEIDLTLTELRKQGAELTLVEPRHD